MSSLFSFCGLIATVEFVEYIVYCYLVSFYSAITVEKNEGSFKKNIYIFVKHYKVLS